MSSASDKAMCLREGAIISDLISIVKVAEMERDRETVLQAIDDMKSVVRESDCIPGPLRDKVSNEVDALHNFLVSRDQEGVKQAVKALQDDIAAPISVKLARGHPGQIIKGYQLRIDGTPVGKPLSRREAPASFEAAMALHPEARVELEPVR